MNNFFDKFKLHAEKEELQTVITSIDNGVVFRGTNLWVLIFAIFVASLGLNVNSTAVIIGAMLISPLMGPIMGIGLGMGINDLVLLKKALYNYFVATIVALATSTVFFLLSPLNQAHSEILARTSPTIYDVLIALFGGLAGIVAISSKQKGNVIPGVAIATALMPPLCTAGYGLATWKISFFIGAFYLFIINTVFIALATLIIVRLLHFPYKHLEDIRQNKLTQRVVWFIVIITLVPSIYFGYDMINQERFTKDANLFITNEVHFPDDYLLSKKIDAEKKVISLVFGGREIDSTQIDALRSKLRGYGLAQATLDLKHGFKYLAEENDFNQASQLKTALAERDKNETILKQKIDSLVNQKLNRQLFEELKAQYPVLKSMVLQPTQQFTDSLRSKPVLMAVLSFSRIPARPEKNKIEKWLKVRMHQPNVLVIFD